MHDLVRHSSAFCLPVTVLALAAQFFSSPAGAANAATAEQTMPTALLGTEAFVDLPSRFDPVRASDANLARYGFPPRPNSQTAPDGYRAWQQAVVGMQRIAPTLVESSVSHGPNLRQGGAAAPDATAASDSTSSNWSGFVIPGPALAYGNQSLINIYGDWVVPTAQLPFNGCQPDSDGAPVDSSTFIGLDGNGSGDVLQAGTESDATCSGGVTGVFQDAWYEWYPYNEVRVSNLAVTPGSVMYVQVWATSATTGHAYIVNETSRTTVSVKFTAPPGYSLTGNSAEWIIERPAVDGVLSSLTNYVQQFMTAARALDAQGNSYFPGRGQPAGSPPAEALQMIDNNSHVISTPSLMGHNGIWFNVDGSASHVSNP